MLAFKRRCETLDQLFHSTRMEDVNPSESQEKNVLVEFDDGLTTDSLYDSNFETSSPQKLAKELRLLKPPSDNSLLAKPSDIGMIKPENPEIIEKSVTDAKRVKCHICDICGRRFSRPSYFVKHMVGHKDGFQCNTCGKKFKRSGYLRRHLLIHTGIKPHVCDYCQKSFLRLDGLEAHMSLCSLLRMYGGKMF